LKGWFQDEDLNRKFEAVKKTLRSLRSLRENKKVHAKTAKNAKEKPGSLGHAFVFETASRISGYLRRLQF
jgi:hypothetical protein